MPQIILWIIAISVSCSFLWWVKFARPVLPYPPSPKGEWFYGNARQMPKELQWVHFAKLTEHYGGYIFFKIFGRPFMVINSGKAAVDLLEKRSKIYSDRPISVMAGELIGWQLTAMLPYGGRWRDHRRLLHQSLNACDVGLHKCIQISEAHKFMQRLGQNPHEFLEEIKRYAGSIIMMMAYGYKLEAKDQYVESVETFQTIIKQIFTKGFLVDILPILKHIPRWFPGAGFQRTAEEWRAMTDHIMELPWTVMIDTYGRGKAPPSYCSTLLDDNGGLQCDPKMQRLVKETSSTLYAAGSDTTTAAISSFFLAMTLHPDVQTKAQEEIDKVIGLERLPTFEDRPNLPFIECIIRELYRWGPASNLGVFHKSIEDDEYEGYFIPAGTTIIPNLWAMLHDPEMYPEPEAFKPERFVNLSKDDSKAMDPRNFAFGFGRRICVGALFADNALFIALVTILSTFDIRKKTINGNEVIPEVEYTDFVGQPKPFVCDVVFRSLTARTLIDAAVDAGRE